MSSMTIVSPARISFVSLIPDIRYPTCPAFNSFVSNILISFSKLIPVFSKTFLDTNSISFIISSNFFFVDIIAILSPFLIEPCEIFINVTIPRY